MWVYVDNFLNAHTFLHHYDAVKQRKVTPTCGLVKHTHISHFLKTISKKTMCCYVKQKIIFSYFTGIIDSNTE